MNTMIFRGYAARIEYSDEDQSLVGHVAGINDVVGFHGDSVAELRIAFEEAEIAPLEETIVVPISGE